jgi:hypothetical protein
LAVSAVAVRQAAVVAVRYVVAAAETSSLFP